MTQQAEILAAAENDIFLVTSGDLRIAANQICWPAQKDLEDLIIIFSEENYYNCI